MEGRLLARFWGWGRLRTATTTKWRRRRAQMPAWTRPGPAKTGMVHFLSAPSSKKDEVFTSVRQMVDPTSFVNKLSPNSQLGLCRIFEKPSRTKRKQWFLGSKRDVAGPNFCPEVGAFKVSLSRAFSPFEENHFNGFGIFPS